MDSVLVKNKVIHRASTRGSADHGWLQSYHTFSFAGYYNSRRMHFGALRVLNDDVVAPGKGFGEHPHADMEIVTIPLAGAIRHGDSMGNQEILCPGEIQVMSAGTGITHSEFNASDKEPVSFLQVWIQTDNKGHRPRYEQLTLSEAHCNTLRVIAAPEGCGSQHVGWIHQSAWMYTLDLNAGHVVKYRENIHGHGTYVFVIEGDADVGGEKLGRRDGMGIRDVDEFLIEGVTDTKLLIIEVPMKLE